MVTAVTVSPFMEFYLDAFWNLSSERQLGFSVGPIPFTSIVTYGLHYGCDDEEIEDLLYFVRQLDEEYLEYTNKKQAKEKPKRMK